MALKGAIGDLNKTTNFFSLSLFQLSLSLILTSRVAVSTTSEARDVAAPRESASSRAAKSEERSRMVAFFFFFLCFKNGGKNFGSSFAHNFFLSFRLQSPFSLLQQQQKNSNMPALVKASKKAAVPAGKGKKKQVSV
jgi:hypothetical protein